MDPIETPQSTGAIEFLAWLEVNKQRLLIGAVAGLGIATIVVCYNYFAEQKEVRAGEALTALNSGMPSPSRPKTPSGDYLKIVAEYSGTGAAANAQLLAGEALFDEGKYAEAQSQFQKFIAEHGDHPLVASAALGVAASLDAVGKADEALAKYQGAARQYSTDGAVSGQAKLSAARILASQGKLTQAHKMYLELAESGRGAASGAWSEVAVTRMLELEKQHPDLAAARMPPTPPPAPVPPPMESATSNAAPQALPGPLTINTMTNTKK
jgi:predicted negative regulator of RcsB-dependent stress response